MRNAKRGVRLANYPTKGDAMSKRALIALAAVCAWMAGSASLQAADPRPLAAEPSEKTTVVQISLGTDLDELVITPEKLRLVTGRLYKLVIQNPSFTTHYFWAPEFGGYATWTDRVRFDKGDVKLRNTGAEEEEEYSTWEIKIEPGGTAIWEFVPVIAGRYKFGCSLPEHAHAGMEGEFEVGPEATIPL